MFKKTYRLEEISTVFEYHDVGMYVIQTKDSDVANNVFSVLVNLKFKDESSPIVVNSWFGGLAIEKFKTIHIYPTQNKFIRKIMNRTYSEITENDFPIPVYDENFFKHWDFKFVMVEKIKKG